MIRLCFLLLWLGCSFHTIAQQKNYTLGNPLELPDKGWNFVLCMKSGNTLLFHFDARNKIMVKVFDSSHKLKATRQDDYNVLDMFMIEYAVLKGAYDINGEAVLFFDQEKRGKHNLIMLRYNGTNGKLIDERLVGESRSANRRMRYYVMKDKEDDNYAILFCMDKHHPKETDMFLVLFNKNHEEIKEIQLPVDRKKFDYLEVLGAESQPDGLLVTVGMDKTLVYGREDHHGALQAGGSVYEHNIAYYFLSKGDTTPRVKTLDLGAAVFPYYTFYTFNSAAGNINSLIFNYKPLYTQSGLDILSGSYSSELFVWLNKSSWLGGIRRLKDSLANHYLKQQTDTSKAFVGIPIKMFTDERGITTIVSGSMNHHLDQNAISRYDENYTSQNIGITQVNADGEELWATVLPCMQFYSHTPRYNRQFIGVNVYNWHNNLYAIFTDYNGNFHNSLKDPGNIIYLFENTNTCYYKLSDKREVTKKYLFGQPRENEYKSAITQTADFDPARGIYATLIQYKKDGETSLRMAWAQLE